MHGLTRVRQFTISEGHLVITPEQVEDEFKGCVDLAKYCLTTLGVEEDVTYRLSLADPDNMDKYLGTREMWDEVEDVMRKMLDHLEIDYTEENRRGSILRTEIRYSGEKCIRQRRYNDNNSVRYVLSGKI